MNDFLSSHRVPLALWLDRVMAAGVFLFLQMFLLHVLIKWFIPEPVLHTGERPCQGC